MTDFAPLGALPLFAGLSAPTRRRLIHGAVERRYAAGATLFLAGTEVLGLYIVLSGRVRVIRSRGGRRHVVHTEGPGGTLAELAFFEEGPVPGTAVATEPTRCLILNRDALRATMREDPAVAWLFLRRLAGRIRELVERLDRASSQGIPARLAAFILNRRDHSEPFALGMTQAELAEELGTVREVIVRALAQLRDRSVIASAGRGRYVVRDAAALTKLAAS